MIHGTRALVGTAMLLLAALSQADEETRRACEGDSQAQLNRCAAQDLQQADAELNQVYREYREALSDGARDGLRDAQRAWLTFRDAQCGFQQRAVSGGSAEPMVRDQCLAALTRQRTEALAELANCPEGDLLCPR